MNTSPCEREDASRMWSVVRNIVMMLLSFLTIHAYGVTSGVAIKSPLQAYTSEELMNEGIRYFHFSSCPDSALICLQVLSDRGNKPNLKAPEADVIGRGMNLMGSILIYQNHDYDRAAVSFLKAYEIGEKYGNRHRMAEANVSLANLNYEEGMLNMRTDFLDETLERYKQAFSQAISDKDYELVGIAGINLATVGIEAGKTKDVANILRTVANMEEIPEWQRLLCGSVLKWSEGDRGKGIEMLDRSIDLVTLTNKTAADNYKLNILYQKALMLFANGKREEAEVISRDAIKKAEEIDAYMLVYLFNHLLHTKMLETGDNDKATAYELAAFRARQRLQAASFKSAIAQGRSNYELETLHDEVVESTAKMRVLRKTLTIIISLSVLLVVLLVVLWLKFRQLKKAKEGIVSRDKAILMNSSPAEEVVENEEEADASEEKKLFARIEQLLAENEEVYEEEFSAGRLAELLHERQATVSAVIQKFTGSGFTALLASARIKEACRRMLDNETYANMTVEGIGCSVGYKSRSHFSRIFKKSTGMSPAEYMKEARLKK